MILLLVIIIVTVTVVNSKWGLLLMLVSYFLMPEIPLDLGFYLKKNHVLMIVLVIYYFKHLILLRQIHYLPYSFCIIYLLISLLLIPFKESKITIQLYYITYDIAIVLFFPIATWNILLERDCIALYRKTLLFCIVIAGVYGLFLLTTDGFNPWTMLFSVLQGNGAESWSRYYADDNRIFGRISSVFFHPMHYAAFLGFSLFYVVYIKNLLSKKTFYFIISILIVNMITCGVRSVLVAIIVSIIIYLILKKNYRVTIHVFLLVAIVSVIAISIPGLDSYVGSIFSKPENSSVGGSSVEMRLTQLEGAFDEISNNVLFGKGYGWCREYIIQNNSHPILLGFESILFVVLCNNGVIGLFLYAMFGLLYYLYVKHHVIKRDRPFFISIIVFYYTYELITGEFAFQFFIIFYTFMLYENYQSRKHLLLKTKYE